MNMNSENKQAIHEVMIADMQKRLYEDIGFANENDYTITLEKLTEDVLHTSSIADINDLLCKYDKLFPSEYLNELLTLDGTLNYVIDLLVSEIYSLEKAYEFNDMFN